MRVNITDQTVSHFLSGLIAVLVLIAIGAFLRFLLRGLTKKIPFVRIALIIALTPLTFLNFLGYSERTALLYYAMATTLLGIIIDGINHLLEPREHSETVKKEVGQEMHEPASQTSSPESESAPGVFVWEKAE